MTVPPRRVIFYSKKRLNCTTKGIINKCLKILTFGVQYYTIGCGEGGKKLSVYLALIQLRYRYTVHNHESINGSNFYISI
jgi:hypothetical protein